ncbi:MAG TPA: alpha/beta fold hydrolase [Ideonella sp.]|uniref:alpha/beta fold hydrolase n=1 Tax=Ideonella sp. TaxID=1929293 RepID=UPI002E354980|nr:alpha/beta fold hydrolase [Ideonella sp.]HEX5685755.1 alpha/beta fold hydrolase [Ideonella sp.]
MNAFALSSTLLKPAQLFLRAQGHGATVVCLHASTGSNAQWRGLVGQLADHWQTMSVDLHGHGRSPGWPAIMPNTLEVEAVAVIDAVRQAGPAPEGVHLVAHSYGAAVALQIALMQPLWVRSLTLYEPVAFGVIHAMAPGDASLAEIEATAKTVAIAVEAGDLEGAARRFIDYWSGAGTWDAMDAPQREAVRDRAITLPRHFEALLNARWAARPLGSLTMPTLLMHGGQTRMPARRVADLVAEAGLPRLRRHQFEAAGHLGPMTHEAAVNAAIVDHLQAQAAASAMAAAFA